jgi:AraC-like DNA-binding protein
LSAHFNTSLPLADLARVAGVTEEHLCRIFKKETGFSPLEFLQILRMEQAKMRLGGEDGNISDIAAMTGFGKSSDMNRCFRKHLGMSSREYRQKTWKK